MCASFLPHDLPILPPACVHHCLYHMVCPSYHPGVYIITCSTLFALTSTLMCTSFFCTHCLPFLPPWCLHHCLRYTVCPFYQTVVYIIICAILFARSDTVMCIALLIVYSPFAPWCVHLLYQTHGWDFSSDSQILEFRFFSESNKNKTKQTRKQCWGAFWMWFFTFQSSNFNPVPSLRTNCLVCSSLCQTICLVCTCYATSFVPCCVPGTSCYSVYISLFIPTLFALYLNHTVEAPGIYMVTIMADYSQMRICSIMCTWFMLHYLPFIIIIYPLIARVVGAPQMISQPVSSIFPCSPLPCGTWQTPGLSIPWCCLPTSSSVCLVFFFPFTVPCKMVLVRPDERKAWPYHCSWHLFFGSQVFVWHDYLLDLGTDFLVDNMVFAWDAYYLAVAPRFHGLYSSLELCCEGPYFISIQEDRFDNGTEKNTPVVPNWFQPFQCCHCLCYPEEYLRLGTLISYNWAQVLEACDCLKILSIYFDLCVDVTVLFVISLVFLALISMP